MLSFTQFFTLSAVSSFEVSPSFRAVNIPEERHHQAAGKMQRK
jgi:hypothetical protein